ncbi:MAG: hypothetical protein ACRC4P_08975, partial [Aeromonas sp.]
MPLSSRSARAAARAAINEGDGKDSSSSSHSDVDVEIGAGLNDESTFVLDHVLEVLIGFPTDSPVKQSLLAAGVTDIIDLLSMDPPSIDQLETTIEDGSTTPLRLMDRIKLKQVATFHRSLSAMRNTDYLSADDWLSLSPTDWAHYRVNQPYYHGFLPRETTTTNSTATTAVAATNTAPNSEAEITSTHRTKKENFTYGIKKDPESYPVFKEGRFWDAWNRELNSKASLHDVSNVLDAHYVPTTADDIDLFEVQKKFMYAVFLSKVQASDAMTIVKREKDAQKCYQQLVHRFEKSAEASLDAQALLEKIQSIRLDKSWRSTPSKFLTYWENQTALLDALTENPEEMWSEKARMAHLVSAVSPNKELAAIWQADLMDRTKGKGAMTYSQYKELLKVRAYALDNEKSTSSRSANQAQRGRNSRKGNTKSTEANNSATATSANSQTNSEKQPPKLDDAKWKKMSREEKDKYIAKRRAWWDKHNAAQGNNNTNNSQATRQANTAETTTPTTSTETSQPPHTVQLQPITVAASGVMQAATQSNDASALRQVLASRTGNGPTSGDYYIANGKIYMSLNTMRMYRTSFGSGDPPLRGALLDGGANGGMAGRDLRILEYHEHDTAQVVGITGNTLEDLPIVTAAGLIKTTTGPIVGIFHQYAYHKQGKTIHSVPQLEAFDLTVDCRSRKKGGLQRVTTPDGYMIPLHVRNGLSYMDMRPPNDSELETYPHVMFTSDTPWDPSCLDDETNLDVANDNLVAGNSTDDYYRSRVSDTGEENQRIIANIMLDRLRDDNTSVFDREDTVDLLATEILLENNAQEVGRIGPDYESLRPCLGYAPLEVIKLTFKNTTQYARNSVRLPFRNHYKSRFPALNVKRRNEPVATDTVWADIPAIDNGATAAQVFVGRYTYVTDVYGCRSDAEFAGLLEDNIRQRGAMELLISDGAKAEISKKVVDILRMYKCGNYMSEANHQHQNFAENRIGTLKDWTNRVLDHSGAPGYTWLLCLEYVSELLNHLANKNLDGQTPLTKLNGVTPDISAFLAFHFYQPVLYAKDNSWPSETQEASGRWVGIANNVGDALTYKILTDDTQKIIFRSAVRARDSNEPNNRIETVSPMEEEGTKRGIIRSKERPLPNVQAIEFTPDDLLGRTFLDQPAEDGTRFRKRIAEKIVQRDENEEKVKFLVTLPDGGEEIIAYNDLLDIIGEQYDDEANDPDRQWTFKNISAHEGPLLPSHDNYKGSKYNVLVYWEDGSSTYEPLDIIAKDDPVTCAQYAQDNGLLDQLGWRRFRRLVKNSKVFKRMVKQANQKSIRHGKIFKYGYEVPRSYADAMRLDKESGQPRW